ncbi:hypothetical protein CFC21_021472 [Triticum aestivum]|uniref:Uncharacterized protein n=2 Tax=Triticum aestivum TaxID=4565 RepID=A0A9R1E9M8_WHEAT|nr:TPD1 protein homolog 1A-like [Triticum aestivum]XP_044319233.1 TPD1 protein homolog 1A-like [Triticum aestivum]XP_044319234.1 TPD1 protein homolog 1A-like [Triticum aestivum]KAF7006423.1 hypothetical protein CFC21_021472 [Triticum aestivum]
MMASFWPLCALVVLLAAVGSVSIASASVADAGSSSLNSSLLASAAPPPTAVLPRKVLRPAGVGADVPHRVSLGCAGADDIAIEQGPGTTLPSGVPSYTVDIINRCSGAGREACAISGIRVRCGWFSSVTLVDPSKFRRVAPDDCLVNDGKPLLADDTISFEYANSFQYKLSVAKATCVHPAADTSD